MKKSFVTLALLTGLFMAFQCAVATAQVSCVEVLKNTLRVIDVAENEGWQILRMNMGTVDKGSVSTYTTTLSGGSTYTIVAVGDGDRVQDIDLVVLDEDEDLVEKDDDSKNIAVVTFTPRRTQEYICAVKGYTMSHRDAFYCIVVIRHD